ncbi:hypothetical protein [Haloplanus aerogenes]|uniref:Uncharacterized protein n=1 Tax=Haloplanus aerogenes TaxID=660522 RepID=A0A3G8QSD8_9EURY|nr:hypothetical protein [Haloplanus aerogenes]AZH24621.1 hypothetical protein DU502_04140 [Haloplanus aerogenes]
MRSPLPTNRLVAFALAGALVTAVVAVGLAVPGIGLASLSDDDATPPTDGSASVAADAPTPNPNFTPAVQTQSGYEEEAHEEHERDDGEDGNDDHAEYDDDDHDDDEDDDYGDDDDHEEDD